jgi:hypothetical protein
MGFEALSRVGGERVKPEIVIAVATYPQFFSELGRACATARHAAGTWPKGTATTRHPKRRERRESDRGQEGCDVQP